MTAARTCVVLQPGYMPWLGYFEQMARADEFVHLDDVQFDKHGWRNRNRIKGPQGPQWLTVPVRVHGRNAPLIRDVEAWRADELAFARMDSDDAETLRRIGFTMKPLPEPGASQREGQIAELTAQVEDCRARQQAFERYAEALRALEGRT